MRMRVNVMEVWEVSEWIDLANTARLPSKVKDPFNHEVQERSASTAVFTSIHIQLWWVQVHS